MKQVVIGAVMVLLVAACNNSAPGTGTTDSASGDSSVKKDNTNMYDTGVGSSMTDTTHRIDTSLIPGKMPDTGIKK